MRIGEVIREHRRRLGLTQEQMADRLGVTAPAVNKWERGVTTPDIGLLCPIARLLEVSLEELLSFRADLTAEALKTYEELLFQSCNLLAMTFQQLYAQAVEANDTARARMLADKQCALAELFEMGEYQALAPKLELTLAERDPDKATALLEKLLESVPTLDGFARSPLYAHMTFKSVDPAFYDGVRESLLSTADEDTGAFLRDDPRWKVLTERYRAVSKSVSGRETP